MARLPGYIRVEGKPYMRDGQCFQDLRVRPWHPSLLAELWRELTVDPAWLKPLIVPLAWLHVIWGSQARGRSTLR